MHTNLALCFPELDDAARKTLALKHFRVLGRSMLERSLFWWARRERLQRLIRVEGEENVHALRDAGKPVLLLAPHFVSLDAGGAAVAMRFDCVSIYAEQSNPLFDELLLGGRNRFGKQQLLSVSYTHLDVYKRQDKIRATRKACEPVSAHPDRGRATGR